MPTRLINNLSSKKPTRPVFLKNPKNYYGYWVNKRNIASNKNHGTLSSGATKKADYLSFNGSDARLDCGLIDISNITEFTITAIVKMDGSGSDEHTICSNWDNAGAKAGLLFRIDPSNSNQLEGFVLRNSNTTLAVNFTDLTLTDDVFSIATLRFNSNNATGLTGFLDGVKSTASAGTSSTLDPTSTTNSFYIGSTPHSPLDGLTGGVKSLQFNKRALSDNEIYRLHANFYKNLSYPDNIFHFPTGAPVVAGLGSPIFGPIHGRFRGVI